MGTTVTSRISIIGGAGYQCCYPLNRTFVKNQARDCDDMKLKMKKVRGK